jgi:hypothetical protein
MLYTKNANVTDTNVASIVTIPSGYVAHWSLLLISNLHNSTNACTVYVDKTSGPDLYIIDGTGVSHKEFLLFSDAVLVLQPGDIIKASTGSSGNVEFVVTFDLLEAPATFVNFSGA